MKQANIGSNRKPFKIFIITLIVLAYMAAIYILSNQPGQQSHRLSSDLADTLSEYITIPQVVYAYMPPKKANMEYLLRKTAHFSEYLILAILLYCVLISVGLKPWKCVVLVFMLCLTYSMFDEYHQTFVPGRSPRLLDVGIDMSGSLLGLIIIQVFSAVQWMLKLLFSRRVSR